MLVMKAITGDVDYMFQGAPLSKAPLFVENEQKAGYKTWFSTGHGSPGALYLNYTYEDETWREVVRDIRFRRALNLGINRDEIIQELYFGRAGKPEEFGWQSSRFDAEEAEKILDEMGMDKRDAEGYRLSPSGNEFEMFIEVVAWSDDYVSITELLVEYLKDLGIRTNMKQIPPSLLGEKWGNNTFMGVLGWAHAELWPNVSAESMDPGYFGYGRAWVTYINSDGEQGEEPPAWINEFYELDSRLTAIPPGDPRRAEVVQDFKAWYNENIPTLICIAGIQDPVIASAKLGNIPESGYGLSATFSAEQFFFE
jgi:peptide/nickel transport system substrate-binding protein